MFKYNQHRPPIILDIEATGLASASYPIEVGFYCSDTKRYSALIKPADKWTYWSTEAEALHQIKHADLIQSGKHLRTVAYELNQHLEGKTVYSDAWAVDSTWLRKLYYQAALEPSFRLSSLELVMTEAMINIWDKTKRQIIKELGLTRHRASSDAKIIQNTWKRAFILSQGAISLKV